jgi:hypothetical protein
MKKVIRFCTVGYIAAASENITHIFSVRKLLAVDEVRPCLLLSTI